MRNVYHDNEIPRRRLLDAACECIKQLGFAGASEAAICEYAGLSRGGLHYHFKRGKVDLLIALAEELYRRAYERAVSNAGQDSGTTLLTALDQAIATQAIGVGDEQCVLVELWLGARSSEKMSATLGRAIESLRREYWENLRELAAPRWDPAIAHYGYLFRTLLRGITVERAAGEGEQSEHLAMLKTLRDWIARELESHMPSSDAPG